MYACMHAWMHVRKGRRRTPATEQNKRLRFHWVLAISEFSLQAATLGFGVNHVKPGFLMIVRGSDTQRLKIIGSLRERGSGYKGSTRNGRGTLGVGRETEELLRRLSTPTPREIYERGPCYGTF